MSCRSATAACGGCPQAAENGSGAEGGITVQCPVCGYVLQPFESQCPRCAKMAAQAPPPAPTRPMPEAAPARPREPVTNRLGSLLLASCHACGRAVSVEAPACPSCGHPVPAGLRGPTHSPLVYDAWMATLVACVLPVVSPVGVALGICASVIDRDRRGWNVAVCAVLLPPLAWLLLIGLLGLLLLPLWLSVRT